MTTEAVANDLLAVVPPQEIEVHGKAPEPVEVKPPPFGHISLHMDGGRIYSRTKAVTFDSPDEMNGYFEENKGLIVVMTSILADGSIVCLLAKGMSDVEIQELQEYQADLDRLREARWADRRKAETEQKIAEEKRLQDERDLQLLGRKCRENHGSVIEDNASLKKEVKKLKAKNR